MRFELTSWNITRLVEEYDAGNIDLCPPYQRNPVWTIKAQQKLIQSILAGKAIPNFFMLRKEDARFEMIDGQQRARTILAYWKNMLVDHENLTFLARLDRSPNRQACRRRLLDYQLSISIITGLDDNESIEEYYALLNSSGLRLNRPELKKAEYFTTNFLKLVMELAEDERLQQLKLFTTSSSARMNDVDFVSELIAAIKYGVSDKKEKVDQLYEDDISLGELSALKSAFGKNLDTFIRFNDITPLIRTRYKQKNDFYTLFLLFFSIRHIDTSVLDDLYRILVKVGPFIRPSQDECEPFREYAHHCVTQSNSKAARQVRQKVLSDLLLNPTAESNPVQNAVLSFFNLSHKNLCNLGPFLTLDAGAIRDPLNQEFEFTDDVVQ